MEWGFVLRSKEEVAPVSAERTLTNAVMLEGFKEIVIRAAGPGQRRVMFRS